MRSSSLLKSDILVLQDNVIGPQCDLMFFDKPEAWYREAERAWRRWSKHANFRDGTSLTELLDKILYSLLCEGDIVLLFDADELDDSGKLILFPADQICPLADSDFATAYGEQGWTQADGIFRDAYGRIVGVCISPTPGATSVRASDALILTKSPYDEEANWVYIKRSFRETVRGVADALPVLADIQDVHEILSYEKISAKRASAQAAVIVEGPQESAVTPEGFIDDEDEGEDENGQGEKDEDEDEYTVEHLADVVGGQIDVLPHGSALQSLDSDRPSPNVLGYVEHAREQIGGALGLTRSFALQKADTSYTAARWDNLAAAKTFGKLQQFLDDHILDWLAGRVIQWHVDHGLIDSAPDATWHDDVAFTHPQLQALDEAKDVAAAQAALKTGTKNLEQLVGPNWRSVLSELAAEKKYAEELGLTLSMGESGNGVYIAPAPDASVKPETEEETNGDN